MTRTALLITLTALLGAAGGCRAPAEKERVVLRVWSMWSGEEERAFRRVLDRYQELHPHVVIRNLGSIRDDTKTIRAIVAGDPPDICTLADTLYLGPMAAQGALTPLDERYREAGFRDEQFTPAALALSRYRGKLYALPFLLDCYALMWNRDLFRRSGLDPDRPPRSIDELERMALALTKRDGAGNLLQLGFAPLSNRSFYAGDIFILFHLFGGRLYDESEARVTADAPQNVAAMRWYAKLIEGMGGLRKVNAFAAGFGQAQGGNNPFFQGKIAMMINGQWNPYWAQEYAPNLDYGVAPLPTPTANGSPTLRTWFGGNLFVIPKGSRHPDEAWKLLAWMQTDEAQFLFADTMHGVPNRRSALPDPRLRSGEKWREQFAVFLDISENAEGGYFPTLPVAGLYQNLMIDTLDFVLEGSKEPAAALREVGRRVQRELDRY